MQFTFPIRSDRLTMTVAVKDVIADVKSEFQHIQIFDTYAFGKMLLLDGHIQLTELDEKTYHEALVHVPMLSMSEPRRALVVGGGDGGVVRELCRHKSLERIDMVEIDRAVVETCVAHMPSLSDGCFDDPRVNLQIADAFKFVSDATEPYDLIVMDSTDTYEDEEGALSEQLVTKHFYKDCRRLLKPTGFQITQADNLLFCPYSLDGIKEVYGSVFKKVGSYFAIVPSFGGFSGYAWASQGPEIAKNYPARAAELGLQTLTPQAYAFGMARLPYDV